MRTVTATAGRSREYATRQLRREKDVDPEQFKTQVRLEIEPLPRWINQYIGDEIRGFMADLVKEIEEEGSLRSQEDPSDAAITGLR